MAFLLDPHAWETSTTTGTGDFTLAGTVEVPALDSTNMTSRRFGDFLSNGDTTWYQARNRSVDTEWEEGIGTWNTGHTLTRTTVLNSSNADAAVSFSAGTKDIICGFPAGGISDSGRQWLDSTDMVYDGDKLGLGVTPTEKLHVEGNTRIEQIAGPELVTNGTFTGSATGWTLGTGWAYNSNDVAHTAGNTAAMSQTVTIVAGQSYRVQVTQVSGTAGTLTVAVGGDSSTLSGGDGATTMDEIFDAVSTASLTLTPTTGYDGVIDNVTITRASTGGLIFEDDVRTKLYRIAPIDNRLVFQSYTAGSLPINVLAITATEANLAELNLYASVIEMNVSLAADDVTFRVNNTNEAASANGSRFRATTVGNSNTGSAKYELLVHEDGANQIAASIYLDGNNGANGQLVIDSPNGTKLNQRMDLKSYTVATLPAVGAAGGIVYVSDAAVAPCLAFSNGTNWKRCDNAATTVV